MALTLTVSLNRSEARRAAAQEILADAIRHIAALEQQLAKRDERKRQRYARAKEVAQAIAGRLT